MPNFTIINNSNEISLDSSWKDAEKINTGSVNIEGRTYSIIKKERHYSLPERVGRGFLGTLCAVFTFCTLGLPLFYEPFSKAMRQFFTKEKENKRFGILEAPLSSTDCKVVHTNSAIVVTLPPRRPDWVEPTIPIERDSSGPFVEESASSVSVSAATPVSDDKAITAAPAPAQSTSTTVPMQLAPISVTAPAPASKPLGVVKPDGLPIKSFLFTPYLLPKDEALVQRNYLNFAVVDRNGKEEVVAVTNPFAKDEYSLYEGRSACEALFQLSCDKNNESALSLLNHPANAIVSESAFFDYVMEKTFRICRLNEKSLLDALQTLQEKKRDLQQDVKVELFETRFPNQRVLSSLLHMDPSVIEQVRTEWPSLYVDAVLKSSPELAKMLLSAMEARSLALTQEEVWIRKVAENDLTFTDDAFKALDPKLKQKIYHVANALRLKDLVERLRGLVTAEEPHYDFGKLSLFARNMDMVTTRQVMLDFLKNMRKSGQLLREEEFTFDASRYRLRHDNINDLQAAEFAKRVAQENNLKHIKIPELIAVVKKDEKFVDCSVGIDLKLVLGTRGQFSQYMGVTVYEELMPREDRKISLQEAVEYLTFSLKTGQHYFSQDYLVADGVKVHTESQWFDPAYSELNNIDRFIESVARFMPQKDFETNFAPACDKLMEAFEKEWPNRLAQIQQSKEKKVPDLVENYGVFRFPVEELFNA